MKPNEKLLCLSAGLFLSLAIVVTGVMFYMPGIHQSVVEAHERAVALEKQKKAEKTLSGVELLNYNTKQNAKKKDFSQQIKITIPKDVTEDGIKVEKDFYKHLVAFFIPGADMNFLYENPLIGGSDHITDISYWEDEKGLHMEFALDSIREPVWKLDQGAVFLDFKSPRELYDKIVVVDAGHGGKMPGTVQNGVLEKDINLAIVKALKERFDDQDSIGVYYTRLSDQNVDFKDRVGLGNELQADLFVSLHQNAFNEAGAAYINGTQVLYHDKEEKKHQANHSGKDMARQVLTTLTNELGSRNMGLVKGSDIYVIRMSKCPAILVEVGFMSNPQELRKLITEEYQDQVAQALYDGIRKVLDEGR